MSTIQETLQKARQVDQKFKLFMSQKSQRDKSMQQTLNKIKKTQQTIASTKQTIGKIDNIYDTFQKRFQQAIDSALKGVQKSALLNVADPDWKPNKIKQKQFVKCLKDHKRILVLTGAGMSVASGIPTFRGANGFWNKQNLKNQIFENVKTPEQILTLTHFEANQFLTWKWLIDFYQIKSKAKANKGHTGLHSIMQQVMNSGRNCMLVTQNIDGFHNQSKNQKKQKTKNTKQYKVCQIHGNIDKIRCDNCSQLKKQPIFYQLKQYIKTIEQKQSPKCPKCDTKLRPHIMFFDQFYSQLYNQSQTIQEYEKQVDLVIVIGTALQTGLSRKIVDNALQNKILIIQINIQCQIKRPNTMWLEGKADQILDRIKYELWKTGI